MDKEFIAPGPGSWALETTHFTGASPSYGLDIFPKGLAKGFQEGLIKYGMPMDAIKFVPVNGFAYAKQVMLGEPEEPKGGPPPSWLLWLMTRIHPAFRERNRNAISALKNRQWEADLAEWDDFYRDDSISRNLALVEVDLAAMSDDELLDHLERTKENLLEMYYRHHKWSVTCMYPLGMFISIATGTGKITAVEAIALMKGSTPVSTGAFRPQLIALREAIESSGTSAEDLANVSPETFIEHMRSINDDVTAAFNDYFRHVCQMLVSGYTIGEKTVIETPNIVKSRVLDAIRSDLSDKGLPADTQALEEEIRGRLSPDELDPFNEWIKNARNINRLRDERGVYNDIWGAGISRHAVLEVGRRLTERGVINDPELAIDATHEELVGLFKSEATVSADELMSRRNWRKTTRIEDVPVFLGDPPSEELPPIHLFPKGLARSTASLLATFGNMNDDLPAAPAEEGTLNGIAVSPGVYEGTARIISGPDDFARLEEGDVLVTKNTSAAFNVVLPILGALVTDRGGLLSHAAIVSREYGIPGVVATKKATREISDGARVRVDGTAGTVSVIS